MLGRRLSQLALTVLLLPLTLVAWAADTAVGPSPLAPPTAVRAWMKGVPVDTLEKGKTYVLRLLPTSPAKDNAEIKGNLEKRRADLLEEKAGTP